MPKTFIACSFARPRVVLSQCIEVEPCRHDGQLIPDPFVARLADFVDFLPVCPEVEIGLGVPRDTIRLVEVDGSKRLVQPSSGLDLTERMQSFAAKFLGAIGEIDGWLLKAGSPSCGTSNVKVYGGVERAPTVAKSPGMFAEAVIEQTGGIGVEDEGRLRNFPIRDHFLLQLFAFADLRRIGLAPSAAALVDFQRRYKHVLMTYDQPGMRELGRIVANAEQREARAQYEEYARVFRRALGKEASRKAHINTLMHMYGHFKAKLGDPERAEFLMILEEARSQQLTLSSARTIIRSWTARYEYEYFADQAYLEPYPRELVMMRDSGKGVEF